MRIAFQTWFMQQPFYEKLVFMHGDRVFDFDFAVDEYRILSVQIAWATWAYLHENLTAVECDCDCDGDDNE